MNHCHQSSFYVCLFGFWGKYKGVVDGHRHVLLMQLDLSATLHITVFDFCDKKINKMLDRKNANKISKHTNLSRSMQMSVISVCVTWFKTLPTMETLYKSLNKHWEKSCDYKIENMLLLSFWNAKDCHKTSQSQTSRPKNVG